MKMILALISVCLCNYLFSQNKQVISIDIMSYKTITKKDWLNLIQKNDTALNKTISTWEYFLPKGTLVVKIIEYYPVYGRCDRATFNSMAIGTINKNDTVRIIEVCPGTKDFLKSEFVSFHPAKQLPDDKFPNLIYIDGNLNPFIFKYPYVKRTTYGELRKK